MDPVPSNNPDDARINVKITRDTHKRICFFLQLVESRHGPQDFSGMGIGAFVDRVLNLAMDEKGIPSAGSIAESPRFTLVPGKQEK